MYLFSIIHVILLSGDHPQRKWLAFWLLLREVDGSHEIISSGLSHTCSSSKLSFQNQSSVSVSHHQHFPSTSPSHAETSTGRDLVGTGSLRACRNKRKLLWGQPSPLIRVQVVFKNFFLFETAVKKINVKYTILTIFAAALILFLDLTLDFQAPRKAENDVMSKLWTNRTKAKARREDMKENNTATSINEQFHKGTICVSDVLTKLFLLCVCTELYSSLNKPGNMQRETCNL